MKKAERLHVLPPSLPPFGVDRVQAAALVGIGETLFDRCVELGLLPQPRVIAGRNVYDVNEIYEAFQRIPHRQADGTPPSLDGNVGSDNPWD